MRRFLIACICIIQVCSAVRVVRRLMRKRQHGIVPVETISDERVTVIVPVLNEENRLGACLESLILQGPEVTDILVVDGGSRDHTREIANSIAGRDGRVRVIDAAPVPNGWNGKAWGLHVGTREASCPWILTIDADVRVEPLLVRSLVAHAREHRLDALSVATAQETASIGEKVLHPALLATVVYRYGAPGLVARRPGDVMANGQCFLCARRSLVETGAFAAARASRCEDITVARALVACGYRVGFYDAPGLVRVRMYSGGKETWHGWLRSLPMHDQYAPVDSMIRLLDVTCCQALPLPLCSILAVVIARKNIRYWREQRAFSALFTVNAVLLMIRLGIAGGMRRAYKDVTWAYMLSPFCDVLVTGGLWRSLVRRRHFWRGRPLV